VIRNGSCYLISNFSQKNQETLSFNGTRLNVVENFISPTDAGITINGAPYTIAQGQAYSVKVKKSQYLVTLTNLTYIPVQDTISLSICASASTASKSASAGVLAVSANGTLSTAPIASGVETSSNLTFWPGSISVSQSPSAGPSDLNVSKVASSQLPPAPSGLTTAVAFNVVLTSFNPSNVSISTTLDYNCSLNASQIAPYLLVNGTWAKITQFIVVPSACTVSFNIPADPVVALMSPTVVPHVSSTSTSTTVLQASGQSSGGAGTAETIIGLAAACIVIAALLIYLGRRAPRQKQPPTAEPLSPDSYKPPPPELFKQS
jgi:hypothetical protein